MTTARRVLAFVLDIVTMGTIALNVRLIDWRNALAPLDPLEPEAIERMRENIMAAIAPRQDVLDTFTSAPTNLARASTPVSLAPTWQPCTRDRWLADLVERHWRPVFYVPKTTDGPHAHILPHLKDGPAS